MASGSKSEMPTEIYVIFNGYGVRYYTTPESFAQALTDGYGHDNGGKPYAVKVFVPVELADDRVAQELINITAAKPPPYKPYNHPHASYNMQTFTRINLTPQEEAANDAYEKQFDKDEKARRKKHKDKLLAGIRAAMGRLRP